MMAESLFGLSPEETARLIGNEDIDRSLKLYGKDYAIGKDMGQSLGGLSNRLFGTDFGPQNDPRYQEAVKLQQIKQNLSTSNIDPKNLDEFYPEMISQLQKAGMIDKAIEMEKQYQTISVAREAAQARGRTAKEQALEAKYPGYKIYNAFAKRKDVDWAKLEAFKKSISDENPGGDTTLLRGADLSPEAAPKKVGIREGTNDPVFVDQEGKTYVNKASPDPKNPGAVIMSREYGVFPLRDDRQSINVKMPEGPKAVLKAEEEVFAADIKRESALVNTLSSLNKMVGLAEQGIVKGTGAEPRIALLNALGTLGLNTSGARKVLNNSQQFQIEAQRLVQQVIKQYGTNPSNADRLYAAMSQPNASQEEVLSVLRAVKEDAEKDLFEVRRSNEHFRENFGYRGYVRQPRNYERGGEWQPLSQRSTEDLQKELNQLRGQK